MTGRLGKIARFYACRLTRINAPSPPIIRYTTQQVEQYTTQEVLTEFLASVAGNELKRSLGINVIDRIHNNSRIEVVPQTPQPFAGGFQRYQNRMDKGYSLVDCISMNTMDAYGITQILTSDHHFNQEGQYTALMRQP